MKEMKCANDRESLKSSPLRDQIEHYKLEAEIASMTWRVNYRDIVRVPPGKLRGSVYSLVRRSSQCTAFSEDAMSVCDMGRQVFVPTAFYKHCSRTKFISSRTDSQRIDTLSWLFSIVRVRTIQSHDLKSHIELGSVVKTACHFGEEVEANHRVKIQDSNHIDKRRYGPSHSDGVYTIAPTNQRQDKRS
ncbi:hypothetical protein J6590_014345 [Homalodisca vitripennis]|nr:hypothetical protein J6590_014345 [Homalodisca vitripennis]